MDTIHPRRLEFHTMPKDQGKPVQLSYALTDDREQLVERRTDKATGEVTYRIANIDPFGSETFAPWADEIPECRPWKECEAAS